MDTQILTQTCSKVKGVFTKRLMKTLSVTITSLALLIGFVGSSFADDADEFTVTMTSGDKTYYSDSGYITHTASVETSHVFNKVDWYVDGVWQATTQGDGERKTASFTKMFSGNGAGWDYWIRAEADSEDGRSAADSSIISVYKNVVDHDGGERDGLVYVEIAKCEWRGNTAYAEMSASVHNHTGKAIDAVVVFGFVVQRLDIDVDNVLNPDGGRDKVHTVQNGDYVCDYFSKSFTPKGDIPEGTRIQLYSRVSCSAGGGTWTAEHSTVHRFQR